jgi:plastocyanin
MAIIRKTLFLTLVLTAILAACAPTSSMLQVTLRAEDIMWNVEAIQARVGQPIEITVRNDGALDHNFVIEELGIDVLLSPGDIEVIPAFTFDEPGTINYICNIPGHEEAGMVGQIIINP